MNTSKRTEHHGEQLQLRPGAEITLETEGPEVTNDYAAYALNATSGDWQLAGRLIDPPVPRVVRPSKAVETYNSLLRRLPSLPDSLTFNERQASPEYCYLTPCEGTRRPYTYEVGEYRSPYAEKQIPAVKLEMDRGYWKAHRRVAFTVNTAYRRHPEWRAFRGSAPWIYTGPMDARAFRRSVSRKHYYQDIELVASSGLGGTLRIKDRGNWIDLPVELPDEAAEDGPNATPPEVALERYDQRLRKKQEEFDRCMRRDLRHTRNRRERMFTLGFAKAIRDMDSTDRNMDRASFDLYAMTAATSNEARQQRDNTALFARRPLFAMPGFGILNCDRMVPLPVIDVPVQVLADNGEPLHWLKAFGVPARGRMVITYWSQDDNAEQRMRLSPECERIIFLDAHRQMIVADVPAGKRNKKGRLILEGRPLDQPMDRLALETLAGRD